MRELVLGTRNWHKVLELRELLAPLCVRLRSLDEFPHASLVVEDGDTFAANAAKKAKELARQLGAWVLAEDSGLSVDALGGRPGVYSARYAGEGATDAANNARLLAELRDVSPDCRLAHYTCHAALADPQGVIRAQSAGTCRGRILETPRGQRGFGYDPLFEVLEFHQTFGELGPAVKAAISHRARAIHRMLPQIARLRAE